MLKALLPVDGSKSALRATAKVVEILAWYKSRPQIDLLVVHPAVPRFPNMSVIVGNAMIERYYADQFKAMLRPSKKILDAAQVKYAVHTIVGPVAESIIEQANQSGSDMICMGTRGRTGFSSAILGSVAARVIHLARIPVVLIH